ncbi:MAG: DNA polymerase/3'-5' exonuclease PolX [Spirochaetia bacterium]|nr:DNA polymerase/3'-5' exonuclease PolX [Spirochaetia bacterium]
MTNNRIIEVLHEIAELLELKGENKFKIRAYLKLAAFLSGYERELTDVYAAGGKDAVLEVPNIGEGIGKKIIELLQTGKLKYLEELRASLPEGVETFMKIPGMGPRTAVFVSQQMHAKNVEELEALLENHKLSGMKGFGEKTEEKIRRGIALYRRGESRKYLNVAFAAAAEIISELKKRHKFTRIEYAGSLRRLKETVGDVDILAESDDKSVMDTFTTLDCVKDVIVKGDTKSSVNTVHGMQADLRLVEPGAWGAALQYFTGSKEHNVLLREIAVKKGYKLNEYGLFTADGKKKTESASEEEIYGKLSLDYIPPELREGSGEIEAALKHALPDLIVQEDIKGDLHSHSSYSDGSDEISVMAASAKKMGYKYLAITDHSKSLKVAHGIDDKTMLKKIKEIDELNKNQKGFMILKGTEVDILPDGSLDYPDELLAKLDIVIGSIHMNFSMEPAEMTERLIRAINNPYLNIIGHISGRLINHREPYEFDYEEVFKAAKKTGTALEINANPERLDLTDVKVKAAVGHGVKLAIGTDSHGTEQLGHMMYGIGVARRGWATKNDVINTWDLDKLLGWVAKKRKA